MEKWLQDILPIMDVEEDMILSRQGDITLGFRVILPEIFSLSNEDYESLHQTWVKALKILPKQSVFHKQDWFTEGKYKPCFSMDDSSFLSLSSERFFNERSFLDHQCYIYLTKK
ncbi:MAG TPA: DUF3875 domain-containing protein, partial [Chitinophagaceae bacterium]